MKKRILKNKGILTIELLIAFAVLLINLTGIILLTHGEQTMTLDSETGTEALTLAQKQMEDAKANAILDFSLVNPIFPASHSDIYTEELKVEDVGDLPNTVKKITSLISWTGDKGRDLLVELETLITNPEALAGGDTCSSILIGDWTRPEIITYKYKKQGNNYNFDTICRNGIRDDNGSPCENGYELGRDVLGDTSSGFPITSIQTYNGKMYVTANNTNGNNDPTFFIVDLSKTPDIAPVASLLGSLDNSPEEESDISEGLNAVAIDGANYAYVANAYDSAPANCPELDNCAQLQIIDISDPENLDNSDRVRDFKVNSVRVGGQLAYGTSVLYHDELIYLGLSNADGYVDNSDPDNPIVYPGHEFFVISVADPLNPVVLDSAEIGAEVNSILVRDNYAYVASPNNEELKIFDVRDPSNIDPQVSGYDAPNNNGNGKSMYAVGNKFYFGRTVNSNSEFYVLDNSGAPHINPLPLGELNIAESINGLLVRSSLAFIVANTSFLTYNVSNDSNIAPYAPAIPLPGPGGVQGTANDCEENFIYVGSKGSNDKGYLSVITGGPEEEN